MRILIILTIIISYLASSLTTFAQVIDPRFRDLKYDPETEQLSPLEKHNKEREEKAKIIGEKIRGGSYPDKADNSYRARGYIIAFGIAFYLYCSRKVDRLVDNGFGIKFLNPSVLKITFGLLIVLAIKIAFVFY